MLHVTINVHCSHSPTVTVTPRNDDAVCGVFVGLAMQYHYVGLHPMPVGSSSDVAQNVTGAPEQSKTAAPADCLDDASIEEGDEQRYLISGTPQASLMCVDNPESFREIISVAPAEGERPLNFMTTQNFEAMSNPDKFPYGTGTFSSNRPRKLSYRKYFNQRLLDVDGRFARDLDYLFVAQYIVEAKEVLDDGNNFAWRQKPSRPFTASQARDQTVLSQYVR